MPFKALIIDDEQPARDIVKHYLQDINDIEIGGEYADGFSAVKAINELKPDIIFLDVQMPKLSGFEVLELLEVKPAVVFTTAFDHFAIKAFEVAASDYLLKPFSYERFVAAVNTVLSDLYKGADKDKPMKKLHDAIEEKQEYLQRIAVRCGQKIYVLPVENITHIEADGDYVSIHTEKEKYLKEKTMKYYETHLDPGTFVRIHRAYVVNVNYIEQLEYYDKESYLAILKNNTKLKVSTNGYRLLKEKLNL